MPDWLAEPDSTLLLALAAVAVCLVAAWWQTRRRQWLIAAAVFAVAAGLLFLFDRLYQSDREQIAGQLQTMAAAVPGRDLDRIFAQVSDSFANERFSNKRGFREYCDSRVQRFGVREVVVWDVQTTEMNEARDHATVTFRFKVHAEVSRGEFFLCRSVWLKEPDGRWRLKSFSVFPPTGFDAPLPIP
jgi:hypothetical protein